MVYLEEARPFYGLSLPTVALTCTYNRVAMTNLQRLRQFMSLPLAERRKILREHAEKLQQHYEDTARERLAWQTGDIVETE